MGTPEDSWISWRLLETLEDSLGIQEILWESLGHFGTHGESFGTPKGNLRIPQNSLGLARTPWDSLESLGHLGSS